MTEPYDTATHAELKLMQGFPPPPDKRVSALNGIWVPPYNRWSYQHMRQIWPTAPVPPAPQPGELPRAIDPTLGALSVTRRDGTPADFDTFLRQTFTDSLVVVHRDRVVFERYLNGMTATQPHIMFSCTKSFIGLMALMAIDEGLVDYDTPLTAIIPELAASSGFADASFGQVLSMTAAVNFSEDYDDASAQIHDYIAILGAGFKADGPLAADDLCAYATTLTRDTAREHGAVFDYQTPQADVLNWAVSRATGRGFIELLTERLWHPLGNANEAYVMLDPAGTLFAGGGLCATAPDMARFASMMAQNGRLGDQQIVPPALMDQLFQGGSREAFAKGPTAEETMADGNWSYFAQWWVRHMPGSEAIIALGVNGQWIYVDRAREVAVIKQSSQPEADNWYFFDYVLNAIDSIVRHVARR